MRTSVALVGAVALFTRAASVIVSLNNPGSTTLHEVWVEPGETFTMDVNFQVAAAAAQVSFLLGASANNVLDVTSIADISPWRTSGATTLLGGLDPESARWTTVYPLPHPFGPGVTSPVQLQVLVASDADWGNYSVAVLHGEYLGLPWIEPAAAVAEPDFIVHVVPEPASGLAFTCLVALASLWKA